MKLRLATLAALLAALSASTGAAGSSEPRFNPPKQYYLALGDSIAYGFQASKFLVGTPAAGFDTGYVDVFSARLRELRPNLAVVNYGCPGETTVSFVAEPCLFSALGNELHDDYEESQLDAALAFLRAHPGQVSPITLTLWGNDVGQFVRSCGGDFSCVVAGAPAAIAGLASRLGDILDELRAEAPDAEIVVTGPWNTFLGFFSETDQLFVALDSSMHQAAVASGARYAAIFPIFNPQGDPDAEAVAICAFTLLCSDGDSHPSDLGYRAIADVVFDASGYARLEAEE